MTQNLFVPGALAFALVLAEPTWAQEKHLSAQINPDWDKTFPKSSKVEHRKVVFKNRYGIKLAADLYLPSNHGKQRLGALVVDGPFGSVKEQASGFYAQNMAERGYAAVAFDRSFTGESGGEPRNVASPEINTDDVSAAVDYLGLLPNVDPRRVGVIGICGGGGFSLNAAAVDTRIKAVVTTSMYDISRLITKGYYDRLSPEARYQMLTHINQQRWVDAEQGHPSDGPSFLPDKIDGVTDPVVRMYFDYYRTPRGFHKRSPNSNQAFTATMPLPFMNTPMLTYISDIAPRPILLIAGEKAHSRYFSEDAYKAAAEPKELLIVKNAVHTDLYDRPDTIPFDMITSFFAKHLK